MMAPNDRLVLLVFSVAMTTTVLGLQFDQSRELVVSQGAPAGTIVGYLNVASRTAGGNLAGNNIDIHYSLHNTSDYAEFRLDPKTGLLSTSKIVDRPVNSTYKIIARALLARSNNGGTAQFEIRVVPPPLSSDSPVLLMEPNHYEGEVEPDSPVGTAVIQAMAFVNGSNTRLTSNISYHMEAFPDDEQSLAEAKNWFGMDERTGVVRLLRSAARPAEITARHIRFTIAAREHDKSLESRAPAVVLFHRLTRPQNLTVIKLSADAAEICWRFPARAGAAGYVLRYWRHPASLDDDSATVTAPPELKIVKKVDNNDNVTANDGEMATICCSLKQLESEAGYKLQVSACGDGDCAESVGPTSAVLHFTTQTNQCLLNGTCETGECQISFEPPGYECFCHSGNYGRRCELYNPCVLSPCQNGATCRNYSNNTFDCSCPEGFDGIHCSTPVGPACLHQEPCLNNGTCSTDGCVCLSGYRGTQCQDYNPCWNDPCPANANCTVLSDTMEYQCVCPLGFRGLECDEAIDYCMLDPCRNDGKCSSRDGFYHCQCTSGYRGVDCEQDVDECQSEPCRNNATCHNQPGSFTCLCPPGYTGTTCDEEVEACLSFPCRNKGVCQNDYQTASYTCFCRPGFSGRDCEFDIDDCNPDPCFNGATCRDLTDAFECICPSGYSGLRCDHEEFCPEEVEELLDKGTFKWPMSGPDINVTLVCPHESVDPVRMEVTDSDVRERPERVDTMYAVRLCRRLEDGTVAWMKSDASACRRHQLIVTEDETPEIVQQPSPKIAATEEVDKIAEQVHQLVDNALIDSQVANDLFQTLSHVMEVDEETMSAATNSCEKILDAIERYTSRISLEPDRPVIMTTPNIAVETVLVSTKGDSYSFRPSFEGDPSAQLISLTVPKEAFQNSDEGVRLRFVSYKNGRLFKSKTNRLPGHPAVVLSATVGNSSVSGLKEPLIYTLPISNSSSFYSCVYWDEIDKDWSTRGVKTRKTDKGMIECLSDHLTSFSILLDPTPMDRISGYHEYILRLISYIGSGLSILGLSITVLLYSLFRNLRRDRGGKILLNLSISLLMLNIVFLIGSVIGYAFKNVDFELRAKSSDRVWAAGTQSALVGQAHIDVCTALTISVHYLVLSSLSWMLVEAVHMYQLLILVFANSETCFMLKRMIAAWGLPLAVVVTTAVLCLEYYQDPSGQTCGRMSQAHPTVYYGAFIGPTCLILLINSIVFLMVLRVILMQGKRGRAVGKVAAAAENGNGNGGTNRLMIMAQLRGAVTVMALLGVTWVAGALAIGPIKVFMTYVFCVCNSLQGFVIFIVRVVQYPEARQSFVILWNTGQTHIPYDATRHSSGPTFNSSGSAANNSGSHAALRARKTLSTATSKSPASSSGRMRINRTGADDSLTPSQAPTLPLGGPSDSSSLSSYQHWFPSATASPNSNGSSQSRFRRIFGQLGLEPSSLRLSNKSNGKSGTHSLLERHVSGATNPPPSPGEKSLHILADTLPLPEELTKPNFLIGEEVSLLHPVLDSMAFSDSSVKRLSVHSLPGGAVSKEGANTSWTFLRPEDEIGLGDQLPYTIGKGSTPVLKSSNGYVERRRASSFLVNPQTEGTSAGHPPDGKQHRRLPRRTLSLSDDPALSLPRQNRVLHS